MRHVPLDEFSILSIHHNPLDHSCPRVTFLWTNFQFVHSSQSSWPILSMHRGVLNEFLIPTAFITTCHYQRQGPNYTFSCAAAVVLAQNTWFVHHSDSPTLDILETGRAWCCTHKSLTAKCRTLPNPSRWTIPIAAVASDLIATWPHKLK